jgi:hypothetical protein
MGSERPETTDSGDESAEGDSSTAPGLRVVVLTREEAEVLLRCSHKYRSTLPHYLQAVKAEFDTLTSIIKKLEESVKASE